MIKENELLEMEIASREDDEYHAMCWGSRDQVQRLIKEIRRLNKKCVKLGADE